MVSRLKKTYSTTGKVKQSGYNPRTPEEKKLKVFQDSITDPKHIEMINRLIPLAEKIASLKVKQLDDHTELRPGKDMVEYRHSFYVEYFHQEMNRLARDAGLRTW